MSEDNVKSKKPWYISSANAEKLSLTIKGFFTGGVISAIVMLMNFTGVDINAADLNSLLESVQGVIVAIGGLGSSLMVLYGVLRKLYNKVK